MDYLYVASTLLSSIIIEILTFPLGPDSHVGPVLDYLAKVDDATKATTDDLSLFKIDHAGLDGIEWAATKLVANNNSWTVTIPPNIAARQYVLRHEIIALHSAGQENGAQSYSQCINIEVTGGGSEVPSGETANKFYTPTDPGILVNIYNGITSYEIPGPALFNGAGSNSVNSRAVAGQNKSKRKHPRAFCVAGPSCNWL